MKQTQEANPIALAAALIKGTGGLYVICKPDGPNVIDLAAEREKRRDTSAEHSRIQSGA